jgi:hypothetical protein
VKQTIIWDLGLDFQTKKNKSYKELIFGVRMSNKKFEHHVTNINIVKIKKDGRTRFWQSRPELN